MFQLCSFRKLSFVCVFLCSTVAFSTQSALPQILDFKTFQAPSVFYEGDLQTLAPCAFSRAPEIGSFFDYLKRTYSINTVVETGSYLGGTTLFFSHVFDRVHTIEISENYFNYTTAALKDYPNTTCHLGSSEKVLRALLPTLQSTPLIFYLDAHWLSYWPLLSELEEISITHRDNCIVVINDIQVPGREEIPYDSYGGDDCSYEYVQHALNKIFTDYTVHFLIPEDVQCRAKLVAIPKQLQAHPLTVAKTTRDKEICLVENCGANPDHLTAILKSRNVDAKVVISYLKDFSNPLSSTSQPCDLASKILFWNIPSNMREKSSYLGPLKEKMVLFMWEPPCIIKEMYSEEVLNCFSKIYTWNDDLVDNVRFFKFYYPVMYPPIHNPPPFQDKKLCTMITGNGKNDDPQALYAERVKAIAFFESKGGDDFDFYGRMADPKGYDFTLFRTYRGPIEDKIKVLKNYRFSICYENTRDIKGYVTEKIFNCFQACNVPIYWGASNIEKYVPKNCFVDRRNFSSLDELYLFIKNMGAQEYDGYIRRIRAFLASEQAKLFSPEQFHNTFAESVVN